MIQKPRLKNYRKGDLVQYLNNVLEIVSEERATALNIAPQRQVLAEVMERFNTSWQPNRGSELTPEIQDLDEKRDSLFMGLKMTADTWATHHFDLDKRSAAFLISDKISNAGNDIVRLRYQEETATLNALILDFQNELSEQVALLNLTNWVEELQEVNTAFNEKYLERAKALSTEQEGVVLQLRTESSEAFHNLVNLFEARMEIAKVDGEDITLYQTVENELNELTEEYNEAVGKQIKKEES